MGLRSLVTRRPAPTQPLTPSRQRAGPGRTKPSSLALLLFYSLFVNVATPRSVPSTSASPQPLSRVGWGCREEGPPRPGSWSRRSRGGRVRVRGAERETKTTTHCCPLAPTPRWRSGCTSALKLACGCQPVGGGFRLCDPMNCRPSGFSVHGILQARRLEWVAIPFLACHPPFIGEAADHRS